MRLKNSPPFSSARTAATPSLDLGARLHRLYEHAQTSEYLFASPLGLVGDTRRPLFLPRFVYFGPQTSDASPRLAVVAGLGRHDHPAARALTAFVENLARRPDIGHALNVSFFPVVDVFGLLGGAAERDLSDADWSRSTEPEIRLLAQDIRLRDYQGFIRDGFDTPKLASAWLDVGAALCREKSGTDFFSLLSRDKPAPTVCAPNAPELAPGMFTRIVTAADDEPSARLRTVLSPLIARSGIEVFSSVDFEPWTASFETLPPHAIVHGPLSLADDLAFAPFEVELTVPAGWPQARADKVVSDLLKRLLTRYRGFLAYGQHL